MLFRSGPRIIISEDCTNKGSEGIQSVSDPETELNQKFWNIVHNQIDYGDNLRVREVELLHGSFNFNHNLIDTAPKTVVGPLLLENGATYYGHW